MHTKSILPADSDTKKEQLPGGVVTVAKGQGSGAQRLSVRPSTQSNLTLSGLRFAYRRVNSKIPQVHAGFGGVGGDMEDLRQLRTSQKTLTKTLLARDKSPRVRRVQSIM
ncbi:hypothetical protein ACFX13_029339 [Malus domestica]